MYVERYANAYWLLTAPQCRYNICLYAYMPHMLKLITWNASVGCRELSFHAQRSCLISRLSKCPAWSWHTTPHPSIGGPKSNGWSYLDLFGLVGHWAQAADRELSPPCEGAFPIELGRRSAAGLIGMWIQTVQTTGCDRVFKEIRKKQVALGLNTSQFGWKTVDKHHLQPVTSEIGDARPPPRRSQQRLKNPN